MGRAWITACVMAAFLLTAGCGQGPGNASPQQSNPTEQSGAANEATQARTVATPPPEQTSHDPPDQAPIERAGLFFPRTPGPEGAYPSALGGGRLVVKDRCIYMSSNVVVWRYGYSLRREDGEVLILNPDEKIVAKVGEEVRMGGGQIAQEGAGPTPEAARRAFEEKRRELGVPDGCRGPLWVFSGIVGH